LKASAFRFRIAQEFSDSFATEVATMGPFMSWKILPVVSGAVLATVLPAYAGLVPVPVPLAGLAGPYGLLAAGVIYGGYRLVRHLRKRP
jgi:hypothetical protein